MLEVSSRIDTAKMSEFKNVSPVMINILHQRLLKLMHLQGPIIITQSP
jgi:hypothetical protein